jgi:hypothetical protein
MHFHSKRQQNILEKPLLIGHGGPAIPFLERFLSQFFFGENNIPEKAVAGHQKSMYMYCRSELRVQSSQNFALHVVHQTLVRAVSQH